MNVLELIRAYLLSIDGIDYVWGDMLPQRVTLPAVVLRIVSSEHEYVLTGAAGCVTSRMQIFAVAATRDEADGLYDLIRESLQGYSGDMLGQWVLSIQLNGESMDVVNPRDGSDNHRYRTNSDYVIVTPETAPVLP